MNSFEAAKSIVGKLRQHGAVAYFAGGCVRDQLLGLHPKDHDVATDATPRQVCRLFRRTKEVGAQFGVVLVAIDEHQIEVATFRTEGPYLDGRRPESVEFTSAEVDAQRRDFTINGMFYDPFEDRVVDYVGGQLDLAAGLIRCIGDPRRRFEEDHLRLLRAVRFAARLGFQIEPQTYTAIRNAAPKLEGISPERVRMELEQILLSPSRARGWGLMMETGLIHHLAPSARWSDEGARRTGRILSSIPDDGSLPLVLAAPLCGFAGETVTAICRELRCSNQVTKAVAFLVESIERALHGNRLELADVKTLLATGLFDDLCALAVGVAGAQNRNPSPIELLRARASQVPAEAIAPPPLVSGDDLKALGIPPGPIYSCVLHRVYRAQLNEIVTGRADAVAMAQSLLNEFNRG
jgi:poly(A) polymerase